MVADIREGSKVINALRAILNFIIVLVGVMVIGFLLALLLVGLFGGKA